MLNNVVFFGTGDKKTIAESTKFSMPDGLQMFYAKENSWDVLDGIQLGIAENPDFEIRLALAKNETITEEVRQKLLESSDEKEIRELLEDY